MLIILSKPRKFKRLVPVAILALAFFVSIIDYKSVLGADDVGGEVYTQYLSSDRESWVSMRGGVITVHMKSWAAASDTRVRYQTIGFGISLSESTADAVSIMGRTGPDAPRNASYFPLSDANKRPVDTIDGWDITEFVFTDQYVFDKLGSLLDNVTEDTYIYLNAIFQTYYLDSNGVKQLREGNEEIGTWKEIMTAESWGAKSLDGFEKYFNIPIPFSPGKQPVRLQFNYEGSRDPIVKDFTYMTAGREYYSLANKVPYNDTYNGKTYVVKSYKVTTNSVSIRPPSNSEWTVDLRKSQATILGEINNTKFLVPLSGIVINIEYALPQYPNTLYYKHGAITRKIADLPNLKEGTSLSWSNEVSRNASILPSADGARLYGYEALTKEGNTLAGEAHVGGAVTEANIIGGSCAVKKGGLNVYLIYTDGTTPPPTPRPTVTPGPTPTPGGVTPAPTPTPAPIPTLPPLAGGGYDKSLDVFEKESIIRADLRDGNRFTSLVGIPSTESLYTQVRGTEYNLAYRFIKKVERIRYPIKVTKTYILKWTNATGGTQTLTETKVVEQTITVERDCAYWVIDSFDYYTLDRAVIYNKALPGGQSLMLPNSTYYRAPDLTLYHSDSQDYHIVPPKEFTDGIDLGTTTITKAGSKPIIPVDDFTYDANVKTGQCQVRNDTLSFNGSVIMPSALYTRETPDLTNLNVLNAAPVMCNRNTLYKWDMVIPATTLNDRYMSYGTLTYRNTPNKVGYGVSTYDVPLLSIDDVVVHTPVICDASITTQNVATGITSNDPYVQTLKVDPDCIQLVLDPDGKLSDFTVDINNYGRHISSNGYYSRDFAWGLRDNTVSYIATKNDIYRNEVKFPFDVFYRDPSGKNIFIAKNTWMRFGHNTPTFYLPMWVNERIYDVDFRTVAVNGDNEGNTKLGFTQVYANTDRTNYVATDKVRVQVSGRIYGLTIYDVTDYPTWEKVIRKSEGSAIFKINDSSFPLGVYQNRYSDGYAYNYTVGTSNQYGIPTGRLDRFTLPLVNGSHPTLSNVGILSTGYAMKFKLTAIGNSFGNGDSVLIKPRFYYVDAQGKNRQEVDLYYTEEFNGKTHKLVKMGSYLDQTNLKSYRCGNQNLGIPEYQLKMMADLKNVPLSSYVWERLDIFSYTNIRIRSPFMTYVNTKYLLDIKNSDQYTAIRAAGIKESDIVRRMQNFYGIYYITADVKAVKKGFDVYEYAANFGVGKHETFWKKNGYIIINFDIVTENGEGEKNLSYINSANAGSGYCSMWALENPVPNKESYNGLKKGRIGFNFLPGDFMVYTTDLSVRDDYESYIIN